uniref:F-box domain-containing protein n=1 Tax=Oryza punctata TaxID=4537 RepID=A0A0E0LL96_ORYPU
MASSRSLLELVDDLIAAILLRLPSSDPVCLIPASLVCKRWRCLLSDPTFLSSYRLPYSASSVTAAFSEAGTFHASSLLQQYLISPIRLLLIAGKSCSGAVLCAEGGALW